VPRFAEALAQAPVGTSAFHTRPSPGAKEDNLRLTFASVCIAAAAAAAVVSVARAMHTPLPVRVRTMRVSVDHYRRVAWLFQRAAHRHTTPTSYSYRRSADPAYLQWTLKQWEEREYDARLHAVAALRRRLGLKLPDGPGIHASIGRRIAYSRDLVVKLQRVSTGHAARTLASAKRLPAKQQLYRWQVKAASMTLTVSRHATRLSVIAPRWLTGAFTCIHHYEGAWNANSGNGAEYLHRWGTADRWPPWAQIDTAVRAYRSGRGFWPWPNTARACGLL
jgi:hypothetical protein